MAGHAVVQSEVQLSRRLYQCGSYLHFRHWIAHGKTTLHAARFCGVPLLCPLCAIRRSAKLLRRYVERAEFVARTHDLWLVTLTVKNGDDLAERFTHLRGALRKLRKRAAKGYSEFARSDGAVWSTEFTKSPETGWHPHVHMVWAMPKGSEPIRYGADPSTGEISQLRQDWHAVTGDSFITHAARIEGDNLVNSFLEVLKYSLKFSELELADNFAAWRTLKGKRLLSSCGIWYGLDLPEDAELADDPLDGPFLDLLFRWAGARGYIADGQPTLDALEKACALPGELV